MYKTIMIPIAKKEPRDPVAIRTAKESVNEKTEIKLNLSPKYFSVTKINAKYETNVVWITIWKS